MICEDCEADLTFDEHGNKRCGGCGYILPEIMTEEEYNGYKRERLKDYMKQQEAKRKETNKETDREKFGW